MTDALQAELPVRRFLLIFAAILVLATVVRAGIAAPKEWVGYDEANYLMIARNAVAGSGYTNSTLVAYHPKFHGLSFLAPQALLYLFGDELAVSGCLFVAFGVLTTLLLGLLANALFGRSVALVAALLAAVAPVLTSLLVASISHSLFLPAFLAALWLAWEAAEQGRTSLALTAGIAVGVSWWARADGLLVAPTIGLFILLGGLLLGEVRKALVGATAYAVGFGALYWLNALFTRTILGGVSVPRGPLLDFLVEPPQCETAKELSSYDSFLELALAEPDCIGRAILENLDVAPGMLFSWTGFPVILLPLLGAAWVAAPHHDRRSIAAHLLLVLGVLPLAFYLPFHYRETRYVAPYALVAFIWCAVGILAIGRRLVPVTGRPAVVVAPLLVAGFLLATTIFHVPRMAALGGLEYAETGRWIDENASPSAVLWTSQAQVAFHARRPWTYPPAPSDASAWTKMGGKEVLLVVDERHFREKNPLWAGLMEAVGFDGFERIFTTRTGLLQVEIFRIHRGPFPAGFTSDAAEGDEPAQ